MPILFNRPSVLASARSIASRHMAFRYFSQRLVPMRSTDEGGGYDADTQAFLTATGITDETISDALDTLVLALKADGIWTKCRAIYPFVGGTDTTHKYNLKDPQDTDAAHRLVFSGSFTHNANGVTGDGSTTYADTKVIPATHLTNNDTHLGAYCRGNSQHNGLTLGVNDTTIAATQFNLLLRSTGNTTVLDSYTTGNGTGRLQVSNSDSSGMILGTRRASNDIESYRNGASIGSGAGVSPQPMTNIDIPIFAFAQNNNGAPSVSRTAYNIAYLSIGSGLTDTEVANYYTRVQAFQTALGRQV